MSEFIKLCVLYGTSLGYSPFFFSYFIDIFLLHHFQDVEFNSMAKIWGKTKV